jgi:hypothetical protein
MWAALWVFDYKLPLALIWTYQRIPARVRGQAFGGQSLSVATASRIRTARGEGWAAIRAAAVVWDRPPRPPLP